jgi:hypothetical protein
VGGASVLPLLLQMHSCVTVALRRVAGIDPRRDRREAGAAVVPFVRVARLPVARYVNRYSNWITATDDWICSTGSLEVLGSDVHATEEPRKGGCTR